MFGEERGVEGVVVKQLVPRGSADRTGKVSIVFIRVISIHLSEAFVRFESETGCFVLGTSMCRDRYQMHDFLALNLR